MVKKNTIGKVQLSIGIIILLISIGGFLSYNYIFFAPGGSPIPLEDLMQQYGNETGRMFYQISLDARQETNIFMADTLVTIISTSIISFFISLLFITQGLVNMGENKIQLRR